MTALVGMIGLILLISIHGGEAEPTDVTYSPVAPIIVPAPTQTPTPEVPISEMGEQVQMASRGNSNSLKFEFTEEDIYILTVMLCGSGTADGDGEYDIDFADEVNFEQISIPLGVVMNRVLSPHFPDTISEVIWQPNQFLVMKRWTKSSTPRVSSRSLSIVKDWTERYAQGEKLIDPGYLFFSGDGIENHPRKGY
jgi:hypothetical protein